MTNEMQSNEQMYLNNSNYKKYSETIIKSSNTKIALSIYESKKGDPTIVFLPGTMVHPLFYDDFLSSVASNGYNVVGVHFVNHGKSPRELKKFTVNDLIINTKDAVSFAIDKYGENVALMGSSQGGLVASIVASQDHRVKAVFAHNFFLFNINETLRVTNFPSFLVPFFKQIKFFFSMLGKIFPEKQMDLADYLDINKACESDKIKKYYFTNPLTLKSYPLSFMSSLFNCDTSGLINGSIKCPFVLITSTGDKLVPYEYEEAIYKKVIASKKEILVFEGLSHLLLVEDVKKVTPLIIEKMDKYLNISRE